MLADRYSGSHAARFSTGDRAALVSAPSRYAVTGVVPRE
jgi:hypothetical protein